MLLKLLSLALSNLKIGSIDGCQMCIQLQLLPLSFRVMSPMLLDSRHAIELELRRFLGCLNFLPVFFVSSSSSAEASKCLQIAIGFLIQKIDQKMDL